MDVGEGLLRFQWRARGRATEEEEWRGGQAYCGKRLWEDKDLSRKMYLSVLKMVKKFKDEITQTC